MPPSSLLTTAIRAVAEACRVTRSVQAELDKAGTLTKADYSPVTIADFAAQAVVCQRLHLDLGRFDLVGEESAEDLRKAARGDTAGAVCDAVRAVWPSMQDGAILDAIDFGNHDASAAAYWTLDPVDGTKGFLRRGQYAVSLALIRDGQVVAGVLGCPNLGMDFTRAFDDPDAHGTLFYAEAGQGAFCLPAMRLEATPIRVCTPTHRGVHEMRMCESVESGHSRQDWTSRVRDLVGTKAAPARLDSQCKYAVVARGQADAYLRLPTSYTYVEKIWDHAAGMLVAQEAGAVVTDIDGKALDFSRGAGLSANRGVVCAPPALHATLRKAIDRLDI